MQKHNSLKPYVAEDWLFPADRAFTFFKESIVHELRAFVTEQETLPEKERIALYPPDLTCIFRAFKQTPYSEVRVVILGQDPYHDPGSATGICFDNPKNRKPSPSLRNILAEIENDTGKPSLAGNNLLSYLEHLPSQGVLLLNAALTVKQGKAGSHRALWQGFTSEVIKSLNKKEKIIWALWGNDARKFKEQITNKSHVIIEGGHPSPFSVRLFKGGKYFTKINAHLSKPIHW